MGNYREDLQARERRAWIEQEEQKEREKQDREQYARYIANLRAEQERTPAALRIEPLSWEEWSSYLPTDEANPTLRGAIATSRTLWKKTMQVEKSKVANTPLEDWELQTLGFDLSERINNPDLELTLPVLKEFFIRFMAEEPRFDKDAHLSAVTDFLTRNKLFPSTQALHRIFRLLLAMNIVQPKKPDEPEPQTKGLNHYGVNLHIERSPEWEAEQRRKDYYRQAVFTDEKTGQSYTQAELDKLSAEEYRAVVFPERHLPTIAHALRRQA